MYPGLIFARVHEAASLEVGQTLEWLFFEDRDLGFEQLWKIAAAQGCGAFKTEGGPRVLDDHLALNQKGIPTVDIIDFNYPHWHRLSDLPENCSGDSIYQVARVLTAWLRQVK